MARRLTSKQIRRMIEAPDLFLMLDCDGTLAPLARHYEKAVFPKRTRSILGRIQSLPDSNIAIISGRELAGIRKFAGMRGLIYAGNHGLEIKAGAEKWIHPGAKRALRLMKQLAFVLRGLLEYFPKAGLEDKRFGLSLHYRLLSRDRAEMLLFAVRSAVQPFVKAHRVSIQKGKKVLELRPYVNWNKGSAVRWLLKKYYRGKEVLPVFIGDDETDEKAFRAVARGISIRVGRSAETCADFFVGSHREVQNLLRRILSGREARRRG